MDEFKEYLNFPDIEAASEYTSILEKHNIPFQLIDNTAQVRLVAIDNYWESPYILKIRDSDIETVNQFFNNEIAIDKNSLKQEHFLYAFSDKDILGVIEHQNEWTKEEIALALQILKERNIVVPEMVDKSNTFPDKPVLIKNKNGNPLLKSIVSVILFVAAFYFLFDMHLNFIFMLVIVIFIHESGHFLAMKYFNYVVVKMFFIPLLGALVTGKKKMVSQRQRAIILLSGPVPGIIIGLILYAIGIKNSNQYLITTSNIFIFLNSFNLLPLTPFDGGNLIRTLFFAMKENINKIFIMISIIGLTIVAFYLHSYVLLIIPLLMLGQIAQIDQAKKIKAALDKLEINYNKPFEELTNREYWLIREQVISNINLLKNIDPKEYVLSKNENYIINKIKSFESNPMTIDLSGFAKVMFTIIWILFLVGPFIIRTIIKYYILK